MNNLPHTVLQLFRYGTVTTLSYVALFSGTYVCVEIFGLPATPSYVAILTLVYIGVYITSSIYVFRAQASRTSMQRFAVAVVFLWALNSSVFYILEVQLQFQYLLAILINIAVFGPIRFVVNKYWVFQTTAQPDQA